MQQPLSVNSNFVNYSLYGEGEDVQGKGKKRKPTINISMYQKLPF